MGDYYRLLRENRFQVHPARFPMSVLVGGCSVANSTMAALQRWRYKTTIANTPLKGPPVFIIGHWRSGTTMMHELLAKDPRFSFPSNFDAFIPSHFLVSRVLFYPLVKLLMPSRRPMDDMPLGADSPQEDDFALCADGAPTPYRRIAFPNRPHRDHLDLNLDQATPETRRQLEEAMRRFLQALTVRYQTQLVLKSPPHTGRLRQLAEWFPEARFVHLSRHPYQLVPSTMRLWRLLDQLQGFQLPRYDDTWLKNYIFECKDLMYSAYFEHRGELPANRLVEVRFEDLVEDPLPQIQRVYQQLELGGFEQVRPALASYFQQRSGHRTNRHQLEPELQSDIDTNWSEYMKEFGYQRQSGSPTTPDSVAADVAD